MPGLPPSPIVHCCLAPSPLGSCHTDHIPLIVKRVWFWSASAGPGATVSGMVAAQDQICQLFWLFVSLSTRLIGQAIIVKTRSWSMKTWTFDLGTSVTWHYVRWTEERGTWYANQRMCAQVNMSVMSTEINLISNRKNCQAREHEEQSYAQTTVGLWNCSISLSASCQKKLFRKINYSYNLLI